MRKICVSDATLVSQKQNKTPLSFREKIETARQLDKLGVDVIELPAIPLSQEERFPFPSRLTLPTSERLRTRWQKQKRAV